MSLAGRSRVQYQRNKDDKQAAGRHAWPRFSRRPGRPPVRATDPGVNRRVRPRRCYARVSRKAGRAEDAVKRLDEAAGSTRSTPSFAADPTSGFPLREADARTSGLMTDVSAITARVERESTFLRDVVRGGRTRHRRAACELLDGMLIGLFDQRARPDRRRPGTRQVARRRVPRRERFGGTFRRIQFTPDLLPSDLVGHAGLRSEDRGLDACAKDPCSATSCWPTRSTVRRPRCNRRCSKPCRRSQVTLAGETRILPVAVLGIGDPKPRGASRARIRSPKPRSTDSYSKSSWAYPSA